MIYIGGNIAILRAVFDLSQNQLAVKMDVTAKAISNYENNVSFPDLNRIEQLRDIFNVSAEILIYYDLSTLLTDNIKAFIDQHSPVKPPKKKGAK